MILNSAPFRLNWGSSIFAKVIAINKYGDSRASDEGNGAEMWTNPDAPISLFEDLSGRSLNSVAFSWT